MEISISPCIMGANFTGMYTNCSGHIEGLTVKLEFVSTYSESLGGGIHCELAGGITPTKLKLYSEEK